jgi:hypothetical protein
MGIIIGGGGGGMGGSGSGPQATPIAVATATVVKTGTRGLGVRGVDTGLKLPERWWPMVKSEDALTRQTVCPREFSERCGSEPEW